MDWGDSATPSPSSLGGVQSGSFLSRTQSTDDSNSSHHIVLLRLPILPPREAVVNSSPQGDGEDLPSPTAPEKFTTDLDTTQGPHSFARLPSLSERRCPFVTVPIM